MSADLAAIRRAIVDIAQAELGEYAPPEGMDLADALDSVQRLALVVAIEDHFEVCFEPEDDQASVTLDDVARVVARRLQEQRGTP